MKVDQVNGGIEVSNAHDDPEKIVDNSCTSNSSELQVYKRIRPKQGLVGKRETGKSDQSSQVPDINPIQISRQRSELTKNLDEQCRESSISAGVIKKRPIQIARERSGLGKNLDERCKESSVSADGIKKIPIQTSKARSELNKELSKSFDGLERSPIHSMRTRSFSQKGSSDGMERSPIQLRKVKSESNKSESNDVNEGNAELRKVKSDAGKALDESVNGSERNSVQLVKAKAVSSKVFGESSGNFTSLDDTRKVLDGSAEGNKKSPTGVTKAGFDENCNELDECEEKVNLGNRSEVKSPPKLEVTDDEDDWDEELEEEVDEEIEIEIEIEKKSFDVKDIRIPEHKAKKIVVEEKKIHQTNVKPVPISRIVKKQPPAAAVVNISRTKPIPFADEFDAVPKTNSKLQSLVDLVMWRDASKSAFIFGLGTFIIVSSSYTTQLNISLISIVSYLGLVYLGAIFLFRSIILRGAMDVDDTKQEHVVGEEEAIWLVKLVLPYVNELLLKLRALFSGDPATTMKLAVLLFVLARCGSSITVWKMGKLGFFGVFTLPKICSSYSSQLSAYGTFWIRGFRDAWESCSHKKAIGFFTFTLLWNLSSIVARIWAVFMLVVAFRYYQYSFMKEGKEVEEEEARGSSIS